MNWLLLPGGPGIGSESLHELADALDVPGAIWLVDLPGDGSNVTPPGATTDPFQLWPGVLREALAGLSNCIYIGHSTAGMYLLATPELERELAGMALLSTAPDSSWHARYVEMTRLHPIAEFEAAAQRFEHSPDNETLCAVAVASAPWNFTVEGLTAGRKLLARMPYNLAATEWSDKNFDHTYVASWWPASLPTLIISGTEDRIVAQDLWDDAKFQGANILRRQIDGGAHFPWIERPDAVRRAFAELASSVIEALEKQ